MTMTNHLKTKTVTQITKQVGAKLECSVTTQRTIFTARCYASAVHGTIK